MLTLYIYTPGHSLESSMEARMNDEADLWRLHKRKWYDFVPYDCMMDSDYSGSDIGIAWFESI